MGMVCKAALKSKPIEELGRVRMEAMRKFLNSEHQRDKVEVLHVERAKDNAGDSRCHAGRLLCRDRDCRRAHWCGD